MYEEEEVTIKEGKELAEKIGAIFQNTSAKTGKGVNELFDKIAEGNEEWKKAGNNKIMYMGKRLFKKEEELDKRKTKCSNVRIIT